MSYHPHEIVVGLGYGDEGKGTIVDFLSHRKRSGNVNVIRFNGGSQAAHNVVTPENIHHTFAQFGSGTLSKECNTIFTYKCIININALYAESLVLEEKGIKNPLSKFYCHELAMVSTHYHAIFNKICEIDSSHKKSSCGCGIGETVRIDNEHRELTIYFKDFFNEDIFTNKIKNLRLYYIKKLEHFMYSSNPAIVKYINELKDTVYEDIIHEYNMIRKLISNTQCINDDMINCIMENESCVCEGAQGMLLDERVGFYPYITKTKCDFSGILYTCNTNARNEDDFFRIGVTRLYMTRHGNGPFVTFDESLTDKLPDEHNKHGVWQGDFKVGWLDLVALRYSIESCMLDRPKHLAITNVDRLAGLPEIKICVAYKGDGISVENLNRFFDWGMWDSSIIINRINARTYSLVERVKLAELISTLKPIYRIFKGYEKFKTTQDRIVVIPKELEDILKYIESSHGLGTRIGIISNGPTRNDKFFAPF